MSMLWIFLILFTTSFFYVTILSFHKLLGAFLVKNTLSNRLNYLTTLAEEQSITRAAARLFISQPALTAFLNRTEEELGARLFDRSTTPIRITEAGAYYLSELEKICVMQDRLHQELSDFSSNDLELRINIGIGRNRGSIWLSSVLPELNRLYPDMRLTIFEDRDINMLDKVLNGVVDIAIVESYTYHSSLHYLRLPSEQYMFITSCENPRMAAYRDAACSPEAPLDIDAGWLADDLFICPSFKGRMNRQTQWMCSTYNFQPKRTLFLASGMTAYRMAVSGMGLTFQNAAYSTFVKTKERPLFIMPGGKATQHHVFALFKGEPRPGLQQDFMRLLHDRMSTAIYGEVTPMEYM